MPLVFEQQLTAHQYECDPWDRMTPGSVLRRVQEISTAQCESVGLDEALYRATHSVFLLSKLSLQVARMPGVNQRIRMQTRAYGVHRAVYQRVTSLYDENGATLCEVDARWVLVNTETRHIYRREPEGFNSPFSTPPSAEGHDLSLVKAEQAPEKMAELPATYTLCDRNGHINNTRYADLLCDLLPTQVLAAGPVREMRLFYRSEIPMGQIFVISGAKVDENGWYFNAGVDKTKNFEANIFV